jgi:two-component system CheB/CheR fusion protein
MGTEAAANLEPLLEYLRVARGFDFTGYKRSTLTRRVQRRMAKVGIHETRDYLDFLQAHPGEFAQLFNTILINVTAYFRDPEEVLPGLLADKDPDSPIRCWCAGVASGEEAYTLAILLAEHLGVEDFKRRVKIYATDVDEEALMEARPGETGERALAAVPDELRARYFEAAGDRRVFRGDLRRTIIFGRHDLVQDAPISRIDVLVCRNTLMYFTAEAQGHILARLHYALQDSGVLFLGKAELLLTHTDLFKPVELKHRIFRKVPKPSARDRLIVLARAGNHDAATQIERQLRLLEITTDALPAAQLVIDAEGRTVVINGLARSWFGLTHRDVGRPLRDLEVSYRPAELRSIIDRVHEEGKARVVNVERAIPGGETQFLDIHVTPLLDGDGPSTGTSITFADVTTNHRLRGELERSSQALETAYEELQSSNEELETTNEELQSTVEELETTNEELQSSNEELETMNEELESTNTELQTINDELRERTVEAEDINTFFESVLASLQLGVIVLDTELRVKLWRGLSDELWGMRSSEVQDQPIASLDIGLPTRDVRRLVHSALEKSNQPHSAVVEATNRRGRSIRCRLVAHALRSKDGKPVGVVLLIEEQAKA